MKASHWNRVSLREPEAKEAWRNLEEAAAEEVKKSAFSQWDFGAGELVRNSYNIVKVTSP
jgi:salicylate hydroxylase